MALPASSRRLSPINSLITASAPGKVVLSGEYAVLAGAPALVMATNRVAHCRLTTESAKTEEAGWRFTASGFDSNSTHPLHELRAASDIPANDPARLCAWVVQQLYKTSAANLPDNVHVHTDTREMYFQGHKLGLGSSAALTTALTGAIWLLSGRQSPEFADIHAAHQASQGGVGSGLDVATSLAGNTIRFQAGTSTAAHWPASIHYRFVYAGEPASTPELVGRFNAWRTANENTNTGAQKSLKTSELTALIDASATLANRGINLDNFARYIDALRALDDAATIGIFSAGHTEIASAAERASVLYKPCGAGGGDLGIALSDSQRSLDRFTADIGNAYAVIDLEIASNGLTIG